MEADNNEGANPHRDAIRLVNRRQDGFIIPLQLPAEAFRARTNPLMVAGDHPHVSLQVNLTYYAYAQPKTCGENFVAL